MKAAWILILTLMYSPIAHAQSLQSGLEPVSTTQILLVGKGLANKSNEESLGLSCIKVDAANPTLCLSYQFVYFKNNTEAFYIGPKFGGTHKQVKHAVRRWIKSSYDNWNKVAPWMAVALVGAAVAGPAIGTMIPFAALSGAALTTLVVNNGWQFFTVRYVSEGAALVANGAGMTDQRGWNWSSSPHPIKDKTFRKLIKSLEDPKKP